MACKAKHGLLADCLFHQNRDDPCVGGLLWAASPRRRNCDGLVSNAGQTRGRTSGATAICASCRGIPGPKKKVAFENAVRVNQRRISKRDGRAISRQEIPAIRSREKPRKLTAGQVFRQRMRSCRYRTGPTNAGRRSCCQEVLSSFRETPRAWRKASICSRVCACEGSSRPAFSMCSSAWRCSPRRVW